MNAPVSSIAARAGQPHHAPAPPGDWVLHIDEPTRALARAVVGDVASTFVGVAEPVWAPSPIWNNPEFGIETSVPRAVTLHGRRREAHLDIYKDNLTLTVSGRGRPGYDLPFWICGPLVADGDATAPITRVIATLLYWQDGLAQLVDKDHAAEAQGYVTALRWLGLGAVASSGLDWRHFSVEPGHKGRHAIRIWSETLGDLCYASAEDVATGRQLSPALSDEIDRIVGDRVHVSEGYRRARHVLPGLMVDFIDHVCLHRDDKPDLSGIARAISDLPGGAELADVDVKADRRSAMRTLHSLHQPELRESLPPPMGE